MLVLTRKKDECIMIGDDIEIYLVDIAPNQVRIGINAPRDVQIYRKEVYDAIKEENLRSRELPGKDAEQVVTKVKTLFEKKE
ncbi:MAG: carbon storage regulator CsrA [Peptococcaceae bacterium]|jgi:carbon storage regulator|nr:carbon storage regulator CsrA [Peptococcaceae bacterium]